MSTILPACAPAANTVWCTDILPILQGIMTGAISRCDVLSGLIFQWVNIAHAAYALSGGDTPPAPPPASTIERNLYGFWGDFVYSFKQIGKAVGCKGSGVRPPGALNCKGDQTSAFSFFANNEYCFGPDQTILDANKKTIFCVECVNGTPILGTFQSLEVVVDMDTGLKDIENLILGCQAICFKCPEDWDGYMKCCQQENADLADRLQKILQKI